MEIVSHFFLWDFIFCICESSLEIVYLVSMYEIPIAFANKHIQYTERDKIASSESHGNFFKSAQKKRMSLDQIQLVVFRFRMSLDSFQLFFLV